MNHIEEVVLHWQQFKWDKKLSKAFGKSVYLIHDQIENLKNSREKTSIWKLVMTDGSKYIPIVLKIFKLPLNENHMVEINMYTKAYPVYHEYMPKLYWLEPNESSKEIWMVTEFVKPLRGQIKLAPHHLELIIPTIAKFHAQTFGNRSLQHSDLIDISLPQFDSADKRKETMEYLEKTRKYLDQAMVDPILKELVEPKYDAIQKILNKGPLFFPEIIEAGQCLIHGDLHVHNICCKNASDDGDWDIQLIDWESVKYAPCWYDLVILVELLIDFRWDWQKREDEIRTRCVRLYAEEMEKHGILFNEDPLSLLKKAYLQRTLEKKLAKHLQRALNGKKSALLKRYLEKVVVWGEELGLV
ncbi:aminoglycoside phosphotransferase family protein [Bacillus salipaludis]|uniref:Aminoglycoside phosphotransferase family protein n=1 Tax=Bacillus salipaludis TaxID=2547811 RepID=A0AA90QTZ6_9BACI|nr:aminoglycoside phosphotransferase family protein [Bacillus salipaludis]MDQ6598217.1 aminoglycoside phosphotransferase family protein [Bacillus salipaludis]